MKSLFEVLKRALQNIVESESGEFLSTRRKTQLLNSEMYTRVGSEAQAQPILTASPTTAVPRSKGYSAPSTAEGSAEVAA